MKKLLFLVALLTLGVFPAVAQKSAPAKAATANKPFVSVEGKFSILFPGEPEKSVSPMDVGDAKFDLYSFVLEADPAVYRLNYFDLSGLDLKGADRMMDGNIAGFVGAIAGARILDQNDLKVGPNPARVARIAMPDGTFFKVKLIVAGSRVYQLTTGFLSSGTIEETIRSSEPLADKFLDSFQISAK